MVIKLPRGFRSIVFIEAHILMTRNQFIRTLVVSGLATLSISSIAGYYDNSLTTYTQYSMRSGMPATDEVTDDWFEGAFTEKIVFETNEVRYRSPVYKGFSIDLTTLLSAKNDREKMNAALKWKGITISHEDGEAKGKFISAFDSSSKFVNAGSTLPSNCKDSKYSCVEKIMINSSEAITLEFSGNKIQYAFNWDKGIQNVVGYSTYEMNSPILLSREVDPTISSSCYSSCGAGSGGRHYYANTETWGSMIDAKGVTTSTSYYFGIDASEYRLYQASSTGELFTHGVVGSFFMMANSYSVKSSGEQEALLNSLYGTNFETAANFSSDLILSMEFNLGYMGVLTLSKGGTQLFAQAGFRGILFMSDSLADSPSFEDEYVIDEFSGSDYTGVYMGVGGTF